jgi:hypothetical protein
MTVAVPTRRVLLLVTLGVAACGVAGGLARLGVGDAPRGALAAHGALMVCGFLGTLIALERAVALGRAWGYLAPIGGAIGALALLAGAGAFAAGAWVVSAVVLVAASGAIAVRQPALHTVLLIVASLAYLAGNVAFMAHAADGVLESWFAFIVLTVAAERVELARLGRGPGGAGLLRTAIALLVSAVVGSFIDPVAGRVTLGIALIALGLWLLRHDVARRTWRAGGFARFAASALLAAYGWLVVGGAAWIAWAAGAGTADVAIHALALGFTFSAVLAHAPVVVPALARVRLPFRRAFYVPLILLHVSLLARVGAALAQAPLSHAAMANAFALAAFALLVVAPARRATRAA